jgi:hypothetical protein
MLVVMNSHATPDQIEQVCQAIRRMNLQPHPMPGLTRTTIGITGNNSAIDARSSHGMGKRDYVPPMARAAQATCSVALDPRTSRG